MTTRSTETSPETDRPRTGDEQPAPKAAFRYAMCNESLRHLSWEAQCRLIAETGYEGVEIAPFTLVTTGVQELGPAERRRLRQTMEEAGLACAGLHWLLAPPPEGLHFTTADAAVRTRTLDYLHALIDFCGDLGGPVMVFGSPLQRNTQGAPRAEALRRFHDGLLQLAPHALERGVQILVEPVGSPHTDVVNTMAEAAAVVRALDHPAIRTMFDFHNIEDETAPLHALIERHRDDIAHVHVQERDGSYLGTGSAVHDYVRAFQALKDLRYTGWVSLEVFDFTPGGRTIAEASRQTLRRIEAALR